MTISSVEGWKSSRLREVMEDWRRSTAMRRGGRRVSVVRMGIAMEGVP